MNLVIVETPLQLLCGYEAYCFENKKAKFVLRLTGRGRNDFQLVKAAGILQLDFKVLNIRAGYLGLVDCLRSFRELYRLLASQWDKIYVGSWYSTFLKALARAAKKSEVYFLDDGVATLKVLEDIRRNLIQPPPLFTFFDSVPIQGQKLVQHDFRHLAERFNVGECKDNYFVGQALVEKEYVTEEEYLNCIKRSAELCEGEFLLYVPHRVEGSRLLKSIEAIPKVKLLRLDVCVELYFYSKGFFPKRIFGCSSTSLITVGNMSKQTMVYSFHIKNVRYEALSNLSAIYEQLGANQNARVFDGVVKTGICT